MSPSPVKPEEVLDIDAMKRVKMFLQVQENRVYLDQDD